MMDEAAILLHRKHHSALSLLLLTDFTRAPASSLNSA